MANLNTNPYHYSFQNLCKDLTANQSRGRNNKYNDYSYLSTPSEFHCSNCDRSFKNNSQYQQHLSEHVPCGREGCQFTAHPKVVANHGRTQHDTGLYRKISCLNNPEEVAKWIAERKRRYPTRQNVEKKAQEKEEKEDRGERISSDKSRFNRHMQFNNRSFGNQHGGGRKKFQSFKERNRQRTKKKQGKGNTRPIIPTLVQSEIEQKVQDDLNGNLLRFKGTAQLYADDIVENIPICMDDEPKFAISDDEDWISESQSKNPVSTTSVSRSLGLLMAYNSDVSDDETDTVPLTSNQSEKTQPIVATEADDNSPPDEVKTVKVVETNCIDHEEIATPVNVKRDLKRQNTSNRKPIHNVINDTKFQRKRKPTLLQQLLRTEIIHERNVILQCVRHIVKHNFFFPIGKPLVKTSSGANKDMDMTDSASEITPRISECELAPVEE